jgi:pyruvate formate lyase activating enzyme
VLAFLEKRKKILDGVVLTGGEPLLHEVKPFLRAVKEKGYAVKLDTNGTNPTALKELVSEGLVDYIAMDIKNSQGKYEQTSGAKVDLSKIEESVEFLKSGIVDYEFRTTVVKPLFNKSDFTAIGEWLDGAKRYFLQAFVDSGDLVSDEQMSAYSDEEMNEFLLEVKKRVPTAKIREKK